MRCSRCGHENTEASKFCRHCGKSLKALPVAQKAASGPRRHVRWGRLVLVAAALVVMAGGGYAGLKIYRAWQSLPAVPTLLSTGFQDSIVYDRYGQPIATLHGQDNRINVKLSQVSPIMQTAIVDTEDHNFYHNPGFDLKSIARAALVDLRHQAAVQGASTITEQLAKNLFLTDNRTLTYKIQEFLLGIKLARTYSKQQILQMYLNTVYFGNGAFGIGAASSVYFDEPASKLTLAQASVLAGLPQAPSLYDPYVNLKLAKQRQWVVLQEMVKYGSITQQQAVAAYHQPLNLKLGPLGQPTSQTQYPWFVNTVIGKLESKPYNLSPSEIYNGGLHIYTTLDPKVYNIAQNAVTQWMNTNFGPSTKKLPNHQAAVVVMDPHTGYVYAIIGGRNPAQAYALEENFALQAQRSTGSSIKPIMEYTPALAKGLTEMTVMQDLPQFKRNGVPWPSNDDHQYRGYIDLRDALAISDNNIAVRLLNKIGLQYGFNFANKKFGLTLNPANLTQSSLAMAIGGFIHGPTPMQMADAYDAIANGGTRMKPIFVTKVTNQYGATIIQNVPQGTPEFSPQVAYIMTKMMERVFYVGNLPGLYQDTHWPELTTGGGLLPGRPAAGKTGTNNGYADAWFDGFTPQLEAVVWEGRLAEDPQNPQYTLNRGPAYGATAAGPIWKQIIEQSSQALNLPVEHFPQPPGIITMPVSITSGLLPSANTPKHDIQTGYFIAGTQPTTTGHNHVRLQVVAAHPNLLWQPGCGPAVTATFLEPEPMYKKGMQLPLDHFEWPPTKMCTAAPATSPGPPGGAGNGTTPPGGNSPPGNNAAPPSTGGNNAITNNAVVLP